MLLHPTPAAVPALHANENAGRTDHDSEPFTLTGLLGSLEVEVRRLTSARVDNLTRDDLRAVEKARNALRTRRRVEDRRLGIPDDADLPSLPPEEPDPVVALRLGRGRYATYRSTLLRTCPWCAYCGRSLTEEMATLDHLLPRAKGGENYPDNLVLACVGCNQSKGSDTPAGWAFRVLTATNLPGQVDELLGLLATASPPDVDGGGPAVLCFTG